MGIGTLGFLKGAARTGLDSIEAREEAERDIKKQKQLMELRARLEQEAKLATVSDVQYEDRDGVMWHVGYSSNGTKVEGSERPATQYELDRIEQDKQKSEFDKKRQSLDLQRLEVGIRNDEDQIRSRQVRDSNDTRSTNAQVAASNRVGRGGGSSGGSSGGGDKKNLSEVLDAIMSRNTKAISELSAQEGVPISTIQEGAWKFAERRLARGDSPLQLERNFSRYLQELRRAAQKQGSKLDSYKRPSED